MNLIVGSTGFLGGEICRLPGAQGSAVRALARVASDPGKVVRLAEQVTGKIIAVQHVPEEALHVLPVRHLKAVREYLQTG